MKTIEQENQEKLDLLKNKKGMFLDPLLIEPSVLYVPLKKEHKRYQEIKEDIIENGYIKPICVKNHPTKPGKFQVIYSLGDLRLQVALEENYSKIPVMLYNDLVDEFELFNTIRKATKAVTMANKAERFAEGAPLEAFAETDRNEFKVLEELYGSNLSERAFAKKCLELGYADMTTMTWKTNYYNIKKALGDKVDNNEKKKIMEYLLNGGPKLIKWIRRNLEEGKKKEPLYKIYTEKIVRHAIDNNLNFAEVGAEELWSSVYGSDKN